MEDREIQREVQRYIEVNYRNPSLIVRDFVLARGISHRSVATALAANSTSWNRMLLDARMRRAKELLSHSAETVEAIALQSGYESAAQFSRTFKAEEGKEPKEYRQWKIEQRQTA